MLAVKQHTVGNGKMREHVVPARSLGRRSQLSTVHRAVQVVKKTGAKLQLRVVHPLLVEQWTQRIRELGRDIARINEVCLHSATF